VRPFDAAPRSPRIEIVYSPVGSGHLSAAHNVALALQRRRPDAEVVVSNVLDFAAPRIPYDAAWTLIQRYGGRLWDWFFDLTDRPCPGPIRRIREWLNVRWLAPLVSHLVERQPDSVVCTHYLPAVAVSQLKRTGRLKSHVTVVVTDHLCHEAWIYPGVDRYHVANPEVARALQARGVAAGAVDVAGIPVAADMDRGAPVRPRLVTGRLKVLLLAAGVPRRLLREGLASLAGIDGLDIDVVAGGDPGLAPLLERWIAELRLPARLHGRLPTLKLPMQQADVVVTKAGGLVVSECLALGRAMVFPWPAPGQERGNRAHAVGVGAAIALDQASALGPSLRQLACQPGVAVEMGMSAARSARRGAAARIAAALAGQLPEPAAETTRAAGAAR
jgi:processive 1,2-diacylglycerol beta-glucosyltransferase